MRSIIQSLILWLSYGFLKNLNVNAVFCLPLAIEKKQCVSAESLNTNYSFKYFGNGKGSSVYRFIDERGILFYATVFSSAERDAIYVI
jgi:hypothetical protein